MVIVVEPPRQGDIIFTLHKQYESQRTGTIFVRRPGKSVPAEPNEVEMLVRRANTSHADLDLSLSVIGPGIRRFDSSSSSVNEWIAAKRADLLKPMHASQNSDPILKMSTAMGLLGSVGMSPLSEPETRKPEEYVEQVENYLNECLSLLVDAARSELVRQKASMLSLQLSNLTEHNVADVEVTLDLSGPVFSYAATPESADLPKPPRRWGPRKIDTTLSALSRFSVSDMVNLQHPRPIQVPQFWTNNHGSTTIKYRAVHLRPHAVVNLPAACVVVESSEPTEVISGNWSATSTDRSGVLAGDVRVNVVGPAFNIVDFV